MDPEAFITKALTKGITSSMSKGMAKVEASFKLPALKQTPEAIKNLTKQERVLEKQILYYKLQESTIGKADRLVEKQLRQTKFMSKVLGEEKNNITIKEKQLEAIKYKKDTASGGVAEAEKGRARRFQEENMIPDQYKQGTIRNKIKGLNVKNFMGRDEGGERAFFQTGADLEKKRASRAKEEAIAAEHMGADFKGQDTDAMWKENQQLETKKQKTKREKGGFAKRAAVGMWKGAMGDSSIDSKHNKSVAENRAEKKQEKLDKKKDAKSRGWLKGMFMNSEDEKKERKEGGILGFFKNHWGKILLGALLLFIPADVWPKIIEFLKGAWEVLKQLFAVLPDIFRAVASGISKVVDFIFGKKDEDGVRQGGLLGKGGMIEGHGLGLAVAGLVGTLGLLMAPLLVLKTALLSIPMFIAKKLGGALLTGTKKLLGFGPKKVPGTTKLDKGLKKPPNWSKMSDVEQKKFNKAQTAKAAGTPKPTGSSAKGPKLTTKVPGAASSSGTKPQKPPGGAGAKKPGVMQKALKKFPKLAKAMPFLRKLPIIGKVFTVGTIAAALAAGAGKKELIPMIGGVFGGVGGGILGGSLGTLFGLAGGPLAFVTGLLGGVGGAMMGDTLGTAAAQFLMGEKVDAFGWGFGWVNDLLNGGKGPEEGGVQTPKGKVDSGGGAPPPMSKNEFLQSKEYKDQVGAGTKDYVGESSGGKKMAYKEYLTKFNADAEKSNELDSLAKQAIQGPRDKIAKIKGKMYKKKQTKKIWKDFAEKIKQFPPEFQDQIKANLKPDELKWVDWKQYHEGLSDERKASLSKASKAASGISGDDDFAGGTAVMVSQGETKRNMFNKTQGENTELKSGQSSGTTIVSAPKTINQQGNAQTDNKFFGNKTAQDQRFADADIF